MIARSRHPTDCELLLVALEDDESVHRALASHVDTCSHCNETLDFLRAVVLAARGMRVPKAPPSLIHRLLHERASGTHLQGARRWHRRRVAPIVAAMAASLALLLGGWLGAKLVSTPREELARAATSTTEDCMRPLPYFAPMAGLVLTVACAQEPNASYPPATDLGTRELHAARWTYESTMRDAGSVPSALTRSVIDFRPNTLGAAPAWLIVTKFDRADARSRWIDSLVVDHDWTPAYRSFYSLAAQEPRALLVGVFTEDATGLSFRDLRRDSAIVLPFPSGPWLVSNGQLPILTQLLPLHREWTGSFFRWGGGPGFGAVDVRVVDEARIVVPAGRFTCWVLEERRHPGGYWTSWWVDKATGWLIKLEQRGMTSLVTNVLVSAELLEEQ